MPQPRVASVPQPKAHLLMGNVPDVGFETPVQNLMKLAQEHGPIFKLRFPAQELYVVSGYSLVNELSDETRFEKLVHGPLKHIRALAGDGLFTADTSMENWGKAHRILMPAFGPAAIRDTFDGMHDIAEQLVTKWARLGDRATLDVPAEMTKLTLDTIALCGFGYRFNSFYQNELHPFVDAMVRALAEAGQRTRQLPVQTKLNLLARLQFSTDIHFMNQVTDALIAERKAGVTHGEKDLLSLMLQGRDPVTGEGLDDVNIRYQMVTFLIAGHETTSGLLSFALYELLQHPALLARAQAEVDAVLGRDVPKFEHLAHLTFLDAVLRETLRVWPTAPAYAVTPRAPTRLAGLDVAPGDEFLVLIPSLHRDEDVWGPDAETFDPERFAPGKREQIPVNAWKPFGNGQRACIGRPFALQEATLVLAMLLQRFELLGPEGYQLKVKETLTLKPEGLTLRVRERPQRPVAQARTSPTPVAASAPARTGHGTPLTVLFGSNSGTSEAFARRIAGDASGRGFAVTVQPMDAAVGALPSRGALLVVTASYNGHPPDNAKRFCEWLDTVPEGSLRGLQFSVFGCGHRDWATTYQAVPTRVDAALARAGATRLVPRGEADGRADFFGDFERWYQPLWAPVETALGVTASVGPAAPLYTLTTRPQPAITLAQAQGYQRATVVENRELVDVTHPLGRSKRHLALTLPEGLTYRCGDSLAVLPENPVELITRVARRFGLSLEAVVELQSPRPEAASLPVGQPLSVRELLTSHVELAQPATRRQVEQLVALTRCPPEKQRLAQAVADDERYRTEVLGKRLSLLDLLEDAPACELTFAQYLELLPPLKPRLYSVSSSPLVDARRCTLTVAVLDAPALSGRGRFRGVGSTYLAGLPVGATVQVAVRAPNLPFRLPEDLSTPLVLVAAGSGLAPFRGFIEERAARAATGERPGPALLYFGCDHPQVDWLYRDELAAWQDQGVVSVRPTFWKAPEGGLTFVQDRLWAERDEVRALLDAGARVLVCGDGARMAPAVKATVAKLLGGDEAMATLERAGRYVADVFS
jgi:cytochrome P450/NADPH-cytochrome P450 reductase